MCGLIEAGTYHSDIWAAWRLAPETNVVILGEAYFGAAVRLCQHAKANP